MTPLKKNPEQKISEENHGGDKKVAFHPFRIELLYSAGEEKSFR